MQTYNAIYGQSIYDVCLQTYGSLDFFFKLLQDNGVLNADAIVNTQQQFIWDDSLVVNQQNNLAFAPSGIYYATEIGASSQAVAKQGILTEDGFFILSEDGNKLVTE